MGVGHGATNPILEKSTIMKPPKPMEEDHGGSQEFHRVVPPERRRVYDKDIHYSTLCTKR
jgi:hypothetical protein